MSDTNEDFQEHGWRLKQYNLWRNWHHRSIRSFHVCLKVHWKQIGREMKFCSRLFVSPNDSMVGRCETGCHYLQCYHQRTGPRPSRCWVWRGRWGWRCCNRRISSYNHLWPSSLVCIIAMVLKPKYPFGMRMSVLHIRHLDLFYKLEIKVLTFYRNKRDIVVRTWCDLIQDHKLPKSYIWMIVLYSKRNHKELLKRSSERCCIRNKQNETM